MCHFASLSLLWYQMFERVTFLSYSSSTFTARIRHATFMTANHPHTFCLPLIRSNTTTSKELLSNLRDSLVNVSEITILICINLDQSMTIFQDECHTYAFELSYTISDSNLLHWVVLESCINGVTVKRGKYPIIRKQFNRPGIQRIWIEHFYEVNVVMLIIITFT